MHSQFLISLARAFDWLSVVAALAALGCVTQIAFTDASPSLESTPNAFPHMAHLKLRAAPFWLLRVILATMEAASGRPFPSPDDLTVRGRRFYLLTFATFGLALLLFWIARLAERYYLHAA
jgi:hypothetical protein